MTAWESDHQQREPHHQKYTKQKTQATLFVQFNAMHKLGSSPIGCRLWGFQNSRRYHKSCIGRHWLWRLCATKERPRRSKTKFAYFCRLLTCNDRRLGLYQWEFYHQQIGTWPTLDQRMPGIDGGSTNHGPGSASPTLRFVREKRGCWRSGFSGICGVPFRPSNTRGGKHEIGKPMRSRCSSSMLHQVPAVCFFRGEAAQATPRPDTSWSLNPKLFVGGFLQPTWTYPSIVGYGLKNFSTLLFTHQNRRIEKK